MRYTVLRALILSSTLAFALPAAAQAPKGDAGGDKREGRDGDKREGRDGDKREGRDGDKREGRDGDKREGRDGDKREGRDGDKREGRDGDKREGRDGDSPRARRGPWGPHRGGSEVHHGRRGDWDDDDDDDDDDRGHWRGRGGHERGGHERGGHERGGHDWRGRRGYDERHHRGRRGPPAWSHEERREHHGDPHERAHTPYAWGGLGYLAIGAMHGSFHFLDEALRDPAALGPGFERGDTAFTVGGGGGALIGRRLWLGGKGYGFILPTESSDRGRARISGGGGGFELGIAAVNRPHALVIPYIGLGGLGTSVTVRNRTAAAMSLGGVPLLPPGEDRTLTGGFWTFDAGIRAFGLYFPGGGGWAAGLDLGVTTTVVPSSYELDGASLSGVAPARMTAGYLRLMLGGGGFFVPGRR